MSAETSTRLAAAEQIARAVADALPSGTTTAGTLLVLAADELAREHDRSTADDLGHDLWEDI